MKHTYISVIIPAGERAKITDDLVRLGITAFDSVTITNKGLVTNFNYICNGTIIALSVGERSYTGDIATLDRMLENMLLHRNLSVSETMIIVNVLTHLREFKVVNRYLVKHVVDVIKLSKRKLIMSN